MTDPPSPPGPRRLTVTAASIRLDHFLRDQLGAGIGRRRLTALVAGGDVRVNGRAAVKGALLRAGDEVVVRAWPEEPRLRPAAGPLPLLYVSDDLVAVDKPPGLPSTAGPSGGASTAALLLARFPEMAQIDARRAGGLVHRLDTGTSGLLLAARNLAAYTRLRDAFGRKAVEKDYLAVVLGRLEDPRAVAGRLRRHPRRRGRMIATRAGEGWMAHTAVTPLCCADAATLVRLRMRTGVTHQLRVHMAMLGHPILADTRYGRPCDAALVRFERAARMGGWHYLHAAALRFDDARLAPELVAAFPGHWRPLFRHLGWRASGTFGKVIARPR